MPHTLSSTIACLDGFYCPNNNASHPPEYCPPTPECRAIRLQQAHNICPLAQGTYEPTVCKSGYYCPSGGQRQIVCPKGYSCPLGSVQPIKCLGLSVCPEGSDREAPLAGVLCIVLLDLLLLGMWIWGDRFRLGSFLTRSRDKKDEFVLESGNQGFGEMNAGTGLDLTFQDVSMRVKNVREEVLSKQSGSISGGSFLGVMGPSGSGKSTLVNILTGRSKPSTGHICINGHMVQSTDLRDLVGFIPQDDILLPDLTVGENILHSARVRIGNAMPDAQLQQVTDTLISNLGLDKARHRLVGDAARRSISGGERKRVSIGLELVAAPKMLVLDEPTSGLDAKTALSLIKLLKSLAGQGVTIVCVIHQPRAEIFAALDDLLLLKLGQQVYFGRAAEAQGYFERMGHAFSTGCNPADQIIDIISSDDKVEPFHSNPRFTECIQDHPSSLVQLVKQQKAPWYRQTYLSFVRGTIQQSRQVASFSLEMACGAITGVLIGLSNYEFDGHLFQGAYHPPFAILSSAVSYRLLTEQGMLCCLAIGAAAGPAGVKTFGEEKLVFYREACSGHSKSAYFLGKALSTIPRIFISALHFTALYMVLTAPSVSFGMQLSMNFLYFYSVYGIGCLIAAVTSPQNGPLLAMLVSTAMSALGGCAPRLATVKTWNLEWFWYIWPGTWFSEASFNEHTASISYLYDIQAAADATGYITGRTGFDLCLLFLIGSIYRAISYLLLVHFAQRHS